MSKSTYKHNGVEYQIILDRSIGPIWDDPDTAEEIAKSLGSRAKHAGNKFPEDRHAWETISVISLPKKSS